MRGVTKPYPFNRAVFILVRNDIDAVAEALRRELPISKWTSDTYGKCITPSAQSILAMQLNGHRWTQLEFDSRGLPLDRVEQLTKDFSARLNTETIFHVFEDVSCIMETRLFQSGELVEMMSFDGDDGRLLKKNEFEGLKSGKPVKGSFYYSAVRQLGPDQLTGETAETFLDSFFSERDALLHLYVGVPVGKSEFVLFDGFGLAEDVKRVDLFLLKRIS